MNYQTRRTLALLFFTIGIFPFLTAQILPITSSPTGTPGEVMLTISAVPPLAGIHDSKMYRVFWDFGDGTYETDTYTEDELVMVGYALEKTHIYKTVTAHEVRAELTGVYTPPDDSNLRYAAPGGTITPGSPPTSPPVPPLKNLYGQAFRVDRTRTLKRNFGSNFLLTYEVASGPNFTCDIARNGGVLEIDYGLGMEPDLALLSSTIWDETEAYHGESITINSVLRRIEIVIPPNLPDANTQRELIFNFFSPEEADVVSTFFNVFAMDRNGNACGDPLEEELLISGNGDPFDPNFKVVEEDTISLNSPQWLHYTLQCQNIGEASTDSITIVDVLDPRLDPSTLKVLEVRMGFEEIINPTAGGEFSPGFTGVPGAPFTFHYQMNLTGNTIEWILDNTGKLRGLKDTTAGLDFVERETIAQIKFQIMTNCLEATNLTIPNSAIVYFDTLAPVFTDTAFTHKFCCQERATGSALLSFDLIQYVDPGLASMIDTMSIQKLSLTSDTVSTVPGAPIVSINNGRLSYQAVMGGYTGIDLLRFVACDANGVCDTFTVAICVNMDPKLYACDTTVCPKVGIAAVFEESQHIHIFPNPFHDFLRVDFDKKNTFIYHLELLNLHGQTCFTLNPNSNEKAVTLDLHHLPVGLYFLRINGRGVGKVVKE